MVPSLQLLPSTPVRPSTIHLCSLDAEGRGTAALCAERQFRDPGYDVHRSGKTPGHIKARPGSTHHEDALHNQVAAVLGRFRTLIHVRFTELP